LIQKEFGARASDSLPLSIGDDAALLDFSSDQLLIVTTDLLIEGTHFRRDIIDPYSLGWKSAAVNISDIAAMAGTPTYAFISIALPDVEVDYVRQIYDGLADCFGRYGVELAGGDTSLSTGGIVINVTQLGLVTKGHETLRKTARPGDSVVVTGFIGESRAGLELLLSKGLEEANRICPKCVRRHLRPQPRVIEAKYAVETGTVRAAMDISDGLATDLGKMCAASGTGARIFAEKIPISIELKEAADALGKDPVDLAISGGEDYELLWAAGNTKLLDDKLDVQVPEIGEFNNTGKVTVVWPDGRETPLEGGWQHF
jgi:thiamine-monophosphate kinase